MTGVVTKVQIKKRKHGALGYGFITDEDGQNYYFILADASWVTLGETVTFQGVRNEKGMYAEDIKALS